MHILELFKDLKKVIIIFFRFLLFFVFCFFPFLILFTIILATPAAKQTLSTHVEHILNFIHVVYDDAEKSDPVIRGSIGLLG